MPVDASFKMLHDVIQGAMGWLDYHLWEFEAEERHYGVLDPDWDDDRLLAAKNAKLSTLLDRGVRQLLYTYDMGDNWEHIIAIEEVETRSEEHTSELQSLMRISYAVFCLKKKNNQLSINHVYCCTYINYYTILNIL